MDKVEKVVDVCLISTGGAYSLANIESILGITILIIQLGWLLTKFVLKVYKYIKGKRNLDELDNDFEQIKFTIEDVVESIRSEEEVDENVNECSK